MLRLVELFLFLSPFVAFVLWRLMVPARGPSFGVVLVAVAILVLMAGALFWFSQQQMLPGDASYAPAQFHDGRLTPGHGQPP